MNWRTTAVLLIILLGLVGYLIFQNRQVDSPETAADTGTLPPPTPERVDLVNSTVEQVSGLNLQELATDTKVLFVRQDSGAWVQTVPTNTLVISNTINSALVGFVTLRSTRSLLPDVNPLSAYGLESPSHQISAALSREGDENTIFRVTLWIGNQTATGSGYYIQKEGDSRVHIVPVGIVDNLIALLTAPPIHLPTVNPLE